MTLTIDLWGVNGGALQSNPGDHPINFRALRPHNRADKSYNKPKKKIITSIFRIHMGPQCEKNAHFGLFGGALGGTHANNHALHARILLPRHRSHTISHLHIHTYGQHIRYRIFYSYRVRTMKCLRTRTRRRGNKLD